MRNDILRLKALFARELKEIISYFSKHAKYESSIDFLFTCTNKEFLPLLNDLELKTTNGFYSKKKRIRLTKIINKYIDFFEFVRQEKDEEYRNQQSFKALIQIPSEIKDFMEKESFGD